MRLEVSMQSIEMWESFWTTMFDMMLEFTNESLGWKLSMLERSDSSDPDGGRKLGPSTSDAQTPDRLEVAVDAPQEAHELPDATPQKDSSGLELTFNVSFDTLYRHGFGSTFLDGVGVAPTLWLENAERSIASYLMTLSMQAGNFDVMETRFAQHELVYASKIPDVATASPFCGDIVIDTQPMGTSFFIVGELD